MPIHNRDIAKLFGRMADLLEIEGANPFRVRAYRNAARMISGLPKSVSEMVAAGEPVTDLPGVGRDLSAKIETIVRTGTLPQLEKLEKEVPPGLTSLLELPGMGPKRVSTLYFKLGVKDLASLRAAAEAGKVRELRGFGSKTERLLLSSIAEMEAEAGERRIRLSVAEAVAGPLVAHLEAAGLTEAVTVAGSFRRRKETVGDLDLLAAVRNPDAAPEALVERFVSYEDAAAIVSRGPARSSVILRGGLQVDLRVVAPESYGAALHYFTGSKAHNTALRRLARRKGLKVNEYGVFEGERPVAGRTEAEVFAAVGLPYIEPELREDGGEIPAALEDRLPRLVSAADIRGDLHAHTNATDGRNTIEEMALAARHRGYGYLAVTEHSKQVAVAHGLDVKRLREHMDRIDRAGAKVSGITLLKGIEVDILADGALDLPDEVLRDLDFAICSVHSRFHLPEEKQTERIIRAMDNPHVHILGHPTGRLINARKPYAVNMEKVMAAARDRGMLLELNAHPDRLDLHDGHCRLAKALGIPVVISTDAHGVEDFDLIRFGIGQARRGWLEPGDVANTRDLADLRRLLRR